jgi:hypothetical protein
MEKVNSIEEARRLAETTGRPVYYEIPPKSQTPQLKLSFVGSLRLRFWLFRKRVQWFLQKVIRK